MPVRFAVSAALMVAATGCVEESSRDETPRVLAFEHRSTSGATWFPTANGASLAGPYDVPARALLRTVFSEDVQSIDEASAIHLSTADQSVHRSSAEARDPTVQVDPRNYVNPTQDLIVGEAGYGGRIVVPRVTLGCGASYTLTIRGNTFQEVEPNRDRSRGYVPETQWRIRTRENVWAAIDTLPSIAGGLNYDRTQGASTPGVVSIGTRLYAAWIEKRAATGVDQLRIAVRDSAQASPAWRFVEGRAAPDEGLNRDVARAAEAPRLHAVGDTLYAAWIERTAGASQLRVAELGTADATPAWTYIDHLYDGATLRAATASVGLNFDPARSVVSPAEIAPAFASDGTNLWLAWAESNGTVGQIRVANKVSVTGPGGPVTAWSLIDGAAAGGLNVDAARDAESPSLQVAEGKLYAAWAESHGATPGTNTSSRIRVAVTANPTAATPTWAPLSGDADPVNASATGWAYSPTLALTGQILNVAWMESGPSIVGYNMHVKSRNLAAAAPAWTAASDDGNSALTTGTTGGVDPNVAVANGELYAAWSEREDTGTAYRVRVKRLIRDGEARYWMADDGVLGADGNRTFGVNGSSGQSGRMPKLAVVPRTTTIATFGASNGIFWTLATVDRITAVWREATLIRASEAQGCD